jgi:hypothetical protein
MRADGCGVVRGKTDKERLVSVTVARIHSDLDVQGRLGFDEGRVAAAAAANLYADLSALIHNDDDGQPILGPLIRSHREGRDLKDEHPGMRPEGEGQAPAGVRGRAGSPG